MVKWNFFLWSVLIGGLLTSSSQAEVYLAQNRLTVKVHEMTVQDVLHKLTHQGKFNIVALEETNIGNVRISKKFWNLPLDQGLDRILSGWNYGISRDVSTGKITTLYLVSQRTEPSGFDANESHTQHAILGETFESNFPDYADDESDDRDNEEKYQEFIGSSDFPIEEK